MDRRDRRDVCGGASCVRASKLRYLSVRRYGDRGSGPERDNISFNFRNVHYIEYHASANRRQRRQPFVGAVFRNGNGVRCGSNERIRHSRRHTLCRSGGMLRRVVPRV